MVTYRDGSARSFSVDRGQVSSLDDGDILMTRPDGAPGHDRVNQDTRLTRSWSRRKWPTR